MSLINDLVRIVQDDDSQRLTALLGRFNPFDVLRIGHYELRHTNTLAWLLDPAGNHGLGETFIRAVVHRLNAQQGEASLANCFETSADRAITVRREVPLSSLRAAAPEGERLGMEDERDAEDMPAPEEGTTSPLKRARAGREGAIDILLEGDEWVLAIEAKVRSSEALEQLPRYREALAAYVQGDVDGARRTCFHVFLTVDGDDPSDVIWQVATWQEHVVDPLEAMLAMRPDMQPDVRRFLESYQETLRRYAGDGGAAETLAASVAQRFAPELRRVQALLRSDPQKKALDSASERVVRRHAPLLRLLLGQLVSPQAGRAESVRTLLKEQGFHAIPGPASYMKFVPKDWPVMFAAMLEGEGRPVMFEFVNRAPKATLKLVVPDLGQDTTDALAPARRDLVRLVQEGGHVTPFRAAFYAQRPGESLRPRPSTEHYFSVYTRSAQLDDCDGPSAANSFVLECLDDINRNVLPILNQLMTQAGLR